MNMRNWTVGILTAVIICGAIAFASPRGEDAPEIVRHRVQEMFRHAAQLRERGSVEDAEHIEGEAEELIHLARKRQELMQRHERMEHEIAELRASGRLDRAEMAQREAREVGNHIEELTHRLKLRDRDVNQLEERIHHLRQAVEHLEAAGYEDWASKLRHDIERQLAEFNAHRQEHERDELHGHVRELTHAFRQLREEVHELREMIEDLRAEREARDRE